MELPQSQEKATQTSQVIKKILEDINQMILKLELELWNEMVKPQKNEQHQTQQVVQILQMTRIEKFMENLQLQSHKIVLPEHCSEDGIKQNNELLAFVLGCRLAVTLPGIDPEKKLRAEMEKHGIAFENTVAADLEPLKQQFRIGQKPDEAEIVEYLDHYKDKKDNDSDSDYEDESNQDKQDGNKSGKDQEGDNDDDVIYVEGDIDDGQNESEEYEDISEVPEDEKQEESKGQEQKSTAANKEDNAVMHYRKHTDFVSRLHQNPINLEMFISGGGDDQAMIWTVDKDQPRFILPKQKETVDCVKFNYNGKLVALGTLDGQVQVYETEEGKLKQKLEGPSDEIRFIEWHAKGNALIAGSADNSLWMWNANNGEFMNSFYGHEAPLTDGKFSPDGTQILTSSEDGTIIAWKPQSGQQIKKIQGYGFHEGPINNFVFHGSNKWLLSTSEDQTCCLSNYETGKPLSRTQKQGDSVECALFNSVMDLFTIGCANGLARVMDIQKFQQREKYQFEDAVIKMIELPEQKIIVAAINNGSISCFDYRQADIIKSLNGGGSAIFDFFIYKDESLIAAYDDGVIRKFELKQLLGK